MIEELTEQQPDPRKRDDGEIYRMIRYYENRDANAASRWWAKLSSSKAKYLRLFLKHERLPEEFDALLRVRALGKSMRIGVLHKVVGMRCDEVRTITPRPSTGL
jgi:hypothetical protein